ncbi:hypothetical protein [Sphingobacterium haloxyli]|uniref:hypothetical protein n=1 Tax=Sphingobacterium haloxyli TaxID=2100533 RepID=UPI001A9F36BF|nr:hypothetical protein [Sphingobacterium haloxyli]
MKRICLFMLFTASLCISVLFAQETPLGSNFKHVKLIATGNIVYNKALILLHPMYDGVDLPNNYLVGHLTARRGAETSSNRLNTVFVNTSSAYRATAGMLTSYESGVNSWKLKTCRYNGVKYIAIDIPYEASQHAHGFQFAGWATSSGESLKFVVYNVNGVPQNTSILTDIQDYTANMNSTQHVRNFNVLGKIGIGTTNPKEELSVNGNIRAREIKVETAGWPDYVFREDYRLKPLSEVERYIREHGHLPEMPKAAEAEANGVSLGEMNKLLLKKVEELTLHLIEKEKEIEIIKNTLLKMQGK